LLFQGESIFRIHILLQCNDLIQASIVCMLTNRPLCVVGTYIAPS